MAVNGQFGVFTSQTILPAGVYSRHHLVEELRHEVIAVGEFAGHARLQVMVLRLRLQRHFHDDLALAIHFQQARLLAGFREENVVADRLDGVDFRLRTLELKDCFAVARHLDGRAAGILFVLRHGQQYVAVGQHPTVARALWITPYRPCRRRRGCTFHCRRQRTSA